LIIIAIIEVFAFLVSVSFFLNLKKKIFFVGIVTLFAGLLPGMMILGFYFKSKKNIEKD